MQGLTRANRTLLAEFAILQSWKPENFDGELDALKDADARLDVDNKRMARELERVVLRRRGRSRDRRRWRSPQRR